MTMNHFENINVEVPIEHLSPLWQKHGTDRKCFINISYSFDGKRTDVFMITAITTRDRHIVRSNKFYDYLDQQADEHAKQKFGLSNAKPIGNMVRNLLVDGHGQLKTCVELAEAKFCNNDSNPHRSPDNSTII
jgi:hypothetical protein